MNWAWVYRWQSMSVKSGLRHAHEGEATEVVPGRQIPVCPACASYQLARETSWMIRGLPMSPLIR